MTNEKLNRLKEVLSIPTYSRNEELMIKYLENVLTEKGFNHYKDKVGNIYVTKGEAEFYPCFVSHTDTVHSVNMNLEVAQYDDNGKTILTGIDSETKKPSGIGGDDKCGVFLCLEMLDKLDNVKAAFFVSEEIGCLGSKEADPEFFKNVGYAIQYDSPLGNSMSMTLMGKMLFEKGTEFAEKVSPLILEHGITSWERHPYTDIWPLMEKFGFACLNLAAGYHKYHTSSEYVVVEEVQNSFELGLKLHESLGESFYERQNKQLLTETSNYETIFRDKNDISDISGDIYDEIYDSIFVLWDEDFLNNIIDESEKTKDELTLRILEEDMFDFISLKLYKPKDFESIRRVYSRVKKYSMV